MSRKNINLTEPVEERAQAIIQRRGFNGLSDMIATLVREEFERRGLGTPDKTDELRDAPNSAPVDAHTAAIIAAAASAAHGAPAPPPTKAPAIKYPPAPRSKKKAPAARKPKHEA